MSESEQNINRVTFEVNLAEIKNNFSKIRNAVAPGKVTAVLKANAYGLGVHEVAKACKEAGADSFGVADLNEALELKAMGLPIMILGNILPDEIPIALAENIIIPINDLKGAQKINAEAVKQNKKANCQLLIDCGMGRLGIPEKKALEEIKKIHELSNLECTGIYSHFPVADSTNEYTEKQIERFRILIKKLEAENIHFKEIHTANSDGINNYPQAYQEPFNRVRLGLNIYGYTSPETFDLREVVSFKSKIILTRQLAVGTFIGYGQTYCLKQDTLVGTVAAGYADGLPLALSNRGHVLVRGKKCPIIGRVSMDYTTIDLTEVPDVEYGEEVVYIGSQGEESIRLQQWAEIKNTHAHDILCAISTRAKRAYTNTAE